MKFGDLLRGLLEEREISQKQLAKDLNIAPSTIGNYIRSTREPDFDSVRRIAAYFGVSADYLLGMSSERSARLTEGERELLRLSRALSGEYSALLIELARQLLSFNKRRGGSGAAPKPPREE